MPSKNPDHFLNSELLRKLAALLDTEVGSAGPKMELLHKIVRLNLLLTVGLKHTLADAVDRDTELLRKIASLNPEYLNSELVASYRRNRAEDDAKLERSFARSLAETLAFCVQLFTTVCRELDKMEAMAEAVLAAEGEALAEIGTGFVEVAERKFAFERRLAELRGNSDEIVNRIISEGVGIVSWLRTELSKLRDGRRAALGEVEIADFSIRLLEVSLLPASWHLVPLFKELLRVDRHRATFRARPYKKFLQAACAEAEASVNGDKISLREIARRAKVSPTTVAKWQKFDDYRKLVAAMTRPA